MYIFVKSKYRSTSYSMEIEQFGFHPAYCVILAAGVMCRKRNSICFFVCPSVGGKYKVPNCSCTRRIIVCGSWHGWWPHPLYFPTGINLSWCSCLVLSFWNRPHRWGERILIFGVWVHVQNRLAVTFRRNASPKTHLTKDDHLSQVRRRSALACSHQETQRRQWIFQRSSS